MASEITETLSCQTAKLKQDGIFPTLAIVRVGERDEDLSYERGAVKRLEACGIAVKRIPLPANVSTDLVLREIRALNTDSRIHGILLLRPLPESLEETKLINAIRPQKDVDGVTEASMAGLYAGKADCFAPCTAEAVIRLLRYYDVPLSGRRAVVVGRSLVIGKPAAMLLLQENATVTVCHTKTKNLPEECRKADIVIAAAGKRGLLNGAFLSEGQTVVDVGIHVDENGRLCGDVEAETAEKCCAACSPVPGGVGSVTTAVLADHVIRAAMALNTEKREEP